MFNLSPTLSFSLYPLSSPEVFMNSTPKHLSVSPHASTHTPSYDSLLDLTIAKGVSCHAMPCVNFSYSEFLDCFIRILFFPVFLCGIKIFIFSSWVCTQGLEKMRGGERVMRSPCTITIKKGKLSWLWEGEGLENRPELPGWFSCPSCVFSLLIDLNWMILCHWVKDESSFGPKFLLGTLFKFKNREENYL